MRNFAVLVIAGALLALIAGCNTGVSAEDTVDKQQEIEDKTEDLMGEPIPEDEQRD